MIKVPITPSFLLGKDADGTMDFSNRYVAVFSLRGRIKKFRAEISLRSSVALPWPVLVLSSISSSSFPFFALVCLFSGRGFSVYPCPRAHYVDRAGLILIENCLPLLLSAGTKSVCNHHPARRKHSYYSVFHDFISSQ